MGSHSPVGGSATLWKPGGQRRSPRVCVCVCVCMSVCVVGQGRGRELSSTESGARDFRGCDRSKAKGAKMEKHSGVCVGVRFKY